MDRNRSLFPRSLLQAPSSFLSSNFPSLWDDMQEQMNQWFGVNTGVDVSEDDQNVYVAAHVPGLKPGELDISLDRNTLRIKGERQEEDEDQERRFYRRAQRSFFYQVELPTQVEENTEQANYEDGVLRITFKKSHRNNVKKINVRGSKEQQGSREQSQSKQQQSKQQSNPNKPRSK